MTINPNQLLWDRLGKWIHEETSRITLQIGAIAPAAIDLNAVRRCMLTVNWSSRSLTNTERLLGRLKEMHEMAKKWGAVDSSDGSVDLKLNSFRGWYRQRLHLVLSMVGYEADDAVHALVKEAHRLGQRESLARLMKPDTDHEDLGFFIL